LLAFEAKAQLLVEAAVTSPMLCGIPVYCRIADTWSRRIAEEIDLDGSGATFIQGSANHQSGTRAAYRHAFATINDRQLHARGSSRI